MRKLPWMENLKIGDQVIIVRHKFSTIETVTGISRKSIFVGENQYSKIDGLSRKTGIGIIEELNEENLKRLEIEKEIKLQYIESQGGDRTKFEKLNEAQLYDVYDGFKYSEWLKNFDSKYKI